MNHRQVEVICRFCGAKGIESMDDPVPGVCPDCLERELALGRHPDDLEPYIRECVLGAMSETTQPS